MPTLTDYQPPYRDDAASIGRSDESVITEELSIGAQRELTCSRQGASDGRSSRLSKYVPPLVQRWSAAVVTWVKGPDPPRPYKINGFFPKIQEAPLGLLDRYVPKKRHRILLLLVFYICWLIPFAAVLHNSAFETDKIEGYGKPIKISCTARFWSDFNDCGPNGDLCRPFDNNTFAFRCPANCERVMVLAPHAVGAREINYRPLVVGGPPSGDDAIGSAIYRGDSFICSAAIHAGFVTDESGGCGVLSLVGEKTDFTGSSRNGITSIPFDSYFPLSFKFLEDTASQCPDQRWPLFGVTLTFTILLSLFTTSPGVFFWSLFIGLFFHVGLVSDPPNQLNYYEIVSTTLGGFLPAAFCGFVMYRYCVKRTLAGLTAQVEKTILWVGACWVGCLNNYTFDEIPLQRLTPHDLAEQPGAVTALVVVVLVILVVVIGQVWALRVEGRLPQYLALYATYGTCILLSLAIPSLSLRLHHYILALLFIAGTAIQTRPSLLYQGLLIGLFINGIARWGFDSVLQTSEVLFGDSPLGSKLPSTLPPIIHDNAGLDIPANITFEWERPFPKAFDGVSVLVNEVERFRAFEDEGIEAFGTFTWPRHIEGLPEYFRFGYMSGSVRGDYTKAGTWRADGSWVPMKRGPSR